LTEAALNGLKKAGLWIEGAQIFRRKIDWPNPIFLRKIMA
jgi:hypothetical protein